MYFALCMVYGNFFLSWASDTDLKKVTEYRSSRQYDKSLEAVESHLKQLPDDRNGLFMKATVLTDLERYHESIVIFQKLIKAYPFTPELYNNLGTVLAFSGQYDDSQKAFQKALHLSHSYRSANKNLDTLKFTLSYLDDLKKKPSSKHILSKKTILSSIMTTTSIKTPKQNNAKTCSKLLESHMLIRQIQTGLSKLGYYRGKIDGTFHSTLKSAIEDFQGSHQLKVNGYTSWKLLAMIQDIIDEKKLLTIQKGQQQISHIHHQRLTQKVQHGLFDLGYYSGPQHGLFNHATQKALTQFIDDYHIQEEAIISYDISGHIMEALYKIQGQWTMVPHLSSESCTHYIPLVNYIESGYKPVRYIGYATILKHKTGHCIMIVNTPTACRDMKKILRPYFDEKHQILKNELRD
jgi:tetratricopeptide (TPR) repeat protein